MQELVASLVALAAAAASDDAVEEHLRKIAARVPQVLPVVDYASLTVARDGGYLTIATSDGPAAVLGQVQAATRVGPALTALQGRAPVGVPWVEAATAWPQFRAQALALGLHASVSIPLFAGKDVIAALDLYARNPAAMTTLICRVSALYNTDPTAGTTPGTTAAAPDPLGRPGALDHDGEAFLAGLAAALDVHGDIQRALGVLIGDRHVGVQDAYDDLRARATAHACSVHTAARVVLERLKA